MPIILTIPRQAALIMFHNFYSLLLDTGITLITFSILYGIVVLVIHKYVDSQRTARQYRLRCFYVTFAFFLFFVAKIWVDDFTRLLTIFGLVSAALVVTNKETIMNLMGGLIILWRGLFNENDLIQIQQYKGFVKSMGALYFTLAEVSDESLNYITGKMIRVPNGLLIANALINYSQFSHLLEQKITIKITPRNFDESVIQQLEKSIQNEVLSFYKNKKEYNLRYFLKKHKRTARYIALTPKVLITEGETYGDDIKLTIQYYCFATDTDRLKESLRRIVHRFQYLPLPVTA